MMTLLVWGRVDSVGDDACLPPRAACQHDGEGPAVPCPGSRYSTGPAVEGRTRDVRKIPWIGHRGSTVGGDAVPELFNLLLELVDVLLELIHGPVHIGGSGHGGDTHDAE